MLEKKRLERRSLRLIHCSNEDWSLSFDENVEFNQEDLDDQNVLLLGTYGQDYLERDQAGRQSNDVQLWYVCQGHEPHFFTRYFRWWETNGFGAKEAYDLARKRVRQENARIDVSSDILDKSHVVKNKYPYKVLVKGELPSDVDPAHKQHHLTDKQFLEVLKTSRFQFYQLPEWQQKQVLKMAHLTSGPRASTSSSLSLPLS